MPSFNDITGRKFGRLTVARHDHRKGPHQFWLCQCECGSHKTVRADHLQQSRVRSCGCLKREVASTRMATHRQTGTVMHKLWLSMNNRCNNPNDEAYKKYGARGIKVCQRWRKFENFYTDMGHRPSPQHSLDRHPNNRGNYEPGNVRWATSKEQANNTRTNRPISAFGKTQNLCQWATETGVERRTISFRLKSGWAAEDAVATPVYGGRDSCRKRRTVRQ